MLKLEERTKNIYCINKLFRGLLQHLRMSAPSFRFCIIFFSFAQSFLPLRFSHLLLSFYFVLCLASNDEFSKKKIKKITKKDFYHSIIITIILFVFQFAEMKLRCQAFIIKNSNFFDRIANATNCYGTHNSISYIPFCFLVNRVRLFLFRFFY